MVDTKKTVVLLLILAIVFSLVSVALTLTLGDFRPVSNQATTPGQQVIGDTNGNLELLVEPRGTVP